MSFSVVSGLAVRLNTAAHRSLPQSDDKELMEPHTITSTSQLQINGMINGQTFECFFPLSSLCPLLCGNEFNWIPKHSLAALKDNKHRG